jgi:nucleoside-diphosphate-sugar epimerase
MNIFLTGASGFIGSSVGATLAAAGHRVRGLVRDDRKREAVRALGIEPVAGALDDTGLLAAEARAADAVISAASSDHRASIDALIAALAGSGKVLIHTSGISVVADEAMGEPSDRIVGEDDPFEPAPDKAARAALDRAVLQAPGVRSVVLCNGLIYGRSLGLASAESVQLPRLIDHARRHGRPAHVGRGLNRWSCVHIADVARLYALAVERARPGLFCFVEAGEASFADMAAAIGRALGQGAPAALTPEAAIAEWGRRYAVYSLGSNSRVRGVRARAELGWRPREAPVLDWIAASLAPAA